MGAYFTSSKANLPIMHDRIDGTVVYTLPGVAYEMLAPQYAKRFGEMHDSAVLRAMRVEIASERIGKRFSFASLDIIANATTSNYGVGFMPIDDRKRGMKDAQQVIAEMEAMEADWRWAADFIDYALHVAGENAIYMNGVYKAFDDACIDY